MGASTVDWFFKHSLVIFCPPKIHRTGDKDSSIHNKQQTSFRSETRSLEILLPGG